MDRIQKVQSEAYSYPYHYIPSRNNNGDFIPSRIWGYARSWLAASSIVEKYLKKYCPKNGLHIDLGCGDGGLINYLARNDFKRIKYIGFDYDTKAIRWADIFKGSTNVIFKCIDILDYSFKETFEADTLSLIEVIEHIPPNKLQDFLKKASSFIKIKGYLILTVPHKNKTLQRKHFQHFSFQTLEENLPPQFKIKEIWGFETMPLPIHLRIIRKLMESKIHYFETKFTNNLFVKRLAEKVNEERAGRIFCLAERIN